MIDEKIKEIFKKASKKKLELPKLKEPTKLQAILWNGLFEARISNKPLLSILDETMDWLSEDFVIGEYTLIEKERKN
jgi:hypothetical protein